MATYTAAQHVAYRVLLPAMELRRQNWYASIVLVHLSYARFYELGLTRELTNPRVGVIPSLYLD